MGENARKFEYANRLDATKDGETKAPSDRRGLERPEPVSNYFNPEKKPRATLDLSNLELPDPNNLKANQIDVGRANRNAAARAIEQGVADKYDNRSVASEDNASYQETMAGGDYKKPERKPTPAEIDKAFDSAYPILPDEK